MSLFLAKTLFLVQIAHMVLKKYQLNKWCFHQVTGQTKGEEKEVQKEGF